MRRILVLIAPFLAVGALAGPAAARPQPKAKAASLQTKVAIFAVEKLGNVVANQNANNGFGQFLMQLGFGDATAGKLEEIQATLREINAKLDAIQKSIKQVSANVERGNCESVQLSLSSAQASVKRGWESFESAVSEAKKATAGGQETIGASLIAKINAAFPASSPALAMSQIHEALTGTGGTPSMIENCGIAFQEASGDFVSHHLHDLVSAKVEYWQTLEAKAAIMDIGMLVDQGNIAEARQERRLSGLLCVKSR